MFNFGATAYPIPLFVANILALILSIGWHEFSHVLVAYALGDRTGKMAGRLTLNPLKHLDPIGTAMILLGAPIGWGRPAPFNPDNLRYRRYGSALVALGGPVSNLLLLTVASGALRFSYHGLGPENLLTLFFQSFVIINASLALFNLIPLPPLDGSWILLALLPRSADGFREFLGRYGIVLLMLLIFGDVLFGLHILMPLLMAGINLIVSLLGIGSFF